MKIYICEAETNRGNLPSSWRKIKLSNGEETERHCTTLAVAKSFKEADKQLQSLAVLNKEGESRYKLKTDFIIDFEGEKKVIYEGTYMLDTHKCSQNLKSHVKRNLNYFAGNRRFKTEKERKDYKNLLSRVTDEQKKFGKDILKTIKNIENKSKISKDDFIAYERARKTGLTNMYHTSNVIKITDTTGHKLSAKKVYLIQDNYKTFMEKYPEVRK